MKNLNKQRKAINQPLHNINIVGVQLGKFAAKIPMLEFKTSYKDVLFLSKVKIGGNIAAPLKVKSKAGQIKNDLLNYATAEPIYLGGGVAELEKNIFKSKGKFLDSKGKKQKILSAARFTNNTLQQSEINIFSINDSIDTIIYNCFIFAGILPQNILSYIKNKGMKRHKFCLTVCINYNQVSEVLPPITIKLNNEGTNFYIDSKSLISVKELITNIPIKSEAKQFFNNNNF